MGKQGKAGNLLGKGGMNMLTLCAWCKSHLKGDPTITDPHQISHGICAWCALDLLGDGSEKECTQCGDDGEEPNPWCSECGDPDKGVDAAKDGER